MVHLAPLIHDLALILMIAGIVSLVFHKIRQPVVLGYILAGLIVGPYTPPFPLVTDVHGIQLWAELGVIFLMFSLGLELSFRKMIRVGISAGITATIEVIFMLVLGFCSGKWLKYSTMDSLFLGAMLSISSTTIIIRALDELKMKTRRFAEIIFAVLVVEDLLAVLVLVGLTTIALNKEISSIVILIAIGKLTLVVGGWFTAGYFIIPRFMKYVGRVGTSEMVTLIALGLCLVLVVFAASMHYSAALGAFIMGSILAESSEAHRIQERIQPMRDLFAAIFFVSIGMLLNPRILWQHLGAVVFITCITVIGKIISACFGALVSGQSLRTSIQVGFGLAQIGEFSFIIATLGATLGVTSEVLYPVGVAVSILTTYLTPYLIRYSTQFAEQIEDYLPDAVSFALKRYSLWAEEKSDDQVKRQLFYQLVLRWFLNGLIVTILFFGSSGFLIPFLKDKISHTVLAASLGWVLTLSGCTPFIWGLLTAFNRFDIAGPPLFGRLPAIGVIFFSRMLALIWLGALSLNFFPIQYVILITGVLLCGLFWLFSRPISASYRWFERQFLSNFETQGRNESDTEGVLEAFSSLAPWDTQLSQVKVHSNSPLQLKSLKDSGLRMQYGVSVIALKRGSRVIVAPEPTELICPQDELLILGTEDQIESVRPVVESPTEEMHSAGRVPDLRLDDYQLKHLRIGESSGLNGLSIRSSGLREKYQAMIVGLEQSGARIINPSPDTCLSCGDVLWLVGERAKLNHMMQQFQKSL